jgi:repeat uncharacterized protein DUF346
VTWVDLGSAGAPAGASWGTTETEVWAIRDGQLFDRYWDGTSWHGWESLGAPDGVRLTGQPAAAARDADRIDVFAVGDDGSLWHRWWDGTRWVAWERVPTPSGADAVSAAWVGRRLDVYVRAAGSTWYLALI